MAEDRHDVDRWLAGLPDKAPAFLAGWHFSAGLRRRVRDRVAFLPQAEARGQPGGSRRLHWKLAVAAALLSVFAGLAWWQRPRVPETVPGPTVKPIQYRLVNLEGSAGDALVSIGRVEGSGRFLALISKHRDPAGWQLIYTQPIDADTVLPVQVMRSRGSPAALILIIYRERSGEAYRYLILELDGEKVRPYAPAAPGTP